MAKLSRFSALCAVVLYAFGAAALPAEYQELEYIESTGSQYINTGVVPGAMFGVTARLNTGTYKSQTAFFGTGWAVNNFLFKQESNNFYFLGNNVAICAVQSDTGCTVTIEPTTGSNGTFTFAPDGGTSVSKAVSLANTASTTSLRIFGTGAANRYASFRLYSFKLYKRETTEGDEGPVTVDVPQLDLVPCEEKATGAYGLYDLVNNKFLPNAGTGVFIVGPHVFSSNTLEVRSRDTAAGTVDTSVNGTYADGAVVTIRATPAAGKRFFRWVGDIEKVADELSPETTVTMKGGADLTALFGGEITVAPTGGDYDNLTEAVAKAKDYDTIVVEDGDYTNTTTSFLLIDKPIAIVAKNGLGGVHFLGRCEAFTDFTKTNCHGLQINNTLAVVRGITFRNYGNDGNDSTAKAIYLQAGLVENCVVSNSRPNWGAYAVRVSGGLLRNTLIRRNRNNTNATSVYGGALYLEGSGVASNCVICNNTSDASNAYGGGVTVNGAIAQLLGCQVYGNTASLQAGGVNLLKGLVENCVISNNSSTAAGVYQKGGTLRNCQITQNESGYGQKYGGVNSEGGAIENCVIRENVAYYPEGKQFRKTSGSVSGTTVVEALHAVPCADIVSVAAGVTVSDCTFQCPSVNGSAELNASDFYAEGDHIRASCLVGPAPLTVEFAVVRDGVAGTPWQKTFDVCGEYLETADGLSCTVKVLPLTTYVSTSGSDTFPYDTPAKATPDFQKAHDAVYADDTVHGEIRVAAGTYDYTGSDVSNTFRPWMLVNKNVTVCGATGNREDVVFDAKRKIMTTYLFHPKAVLKDLTISNGRYNTSAAYGATLHMMDGLVTNCVISKGFANYKGNATIRGGEVVDSVFREGTLNQSGTDRPGGGLNVLGTCFVHDCLFENNFGGYGAGVYLEASGAVVSNCVIRGGSGGSCGGAGACVKSGLLTHCVITNNSSSGPAGGVCIVGGTARNCLIANNMSKGAVAPKISSSGAGGGGVAMSSGTLENCTVAYNTSAATTRCDELYQTGGTVRNCLFLGKDDNVANDVYKTGGTATYCCFRTAVTGEGNTTDDPKLKAPALGDFTLLYGSSCIDAGQTIAAVTSDLRGESRPAGEAYDIGAYEMDFSGAMVAAFDVNNTLGAGSVTATLTATVVGGSAPYTYKWTIGGKVYETDGPAYTHTFGYGSHDVALVVVDANGNETEPVVRQDVVRVKTAVAYVSNEGSAEWPYDTWAKATPDWSEAAKAVYFDDETPGRVYVADGTYMAHDNDVYSVTLADPIEFIGTNPLCRAVFNGQGKEHRVFNVANARAKVANITIYNAKGGYSPTPGAMTLADGQVTNCVFDTNSANGGGLVTMSGGRLVDCILRNSNAGGYAGGDRHGGGIVVSGGLLENTVISNCVDGVAGGVLLYGDSGVVRNCLIAGCKASGGFGGGAVVLRGVMENCVISNCTQTGSSTSCGINGNVENRSSQCGGVYALGTSAVVRNCLIVGCRSEGVLPVGSGAYVANGATTYNNTVWANTLKGGATNDVYLAGGTVANTLACVLSAAEGTDAPDHCFVAETDGDPKFRKAGSVPLLPKSVSPCVNGGNAAYWAGVEAPTDLRGNPRVLNRQVDIGCYEVPQSGLTVFVR